MTVDVGSSLLIGFLLASVRGAAWLFVSPPFAARTVPALVKAGLAMALALPVAPKLAPAAPAMSLPELVAAILTQVFAGLALGFITLMIFAALQAAGDLLDLFGGFTMSAAFDPLSMNQSSVLGRLNGFLGIIVLFAIDGHLMLLDGFFRSYDAIPLDALINPGDLARVLTVGLSQFFLAALQIAAPLIAVLFLIDAGLGLLTKISPALNAFALGFPAKILVTLILVGAALPLLPQIVNSLVTMALEAMSAVLRR